MSKDNQKSLEQKPEIGKMPTPKYLVRAGDTTGNGQIEWIGIETYSATQTIKNFLWWRNLDIKTDINDAKIGMIYPNL
jgi:hypothetical protein